MKPPSAKLHVVQGPPSLKDFELGKKPLQIGRDMGDAATAQELRIADPRVSQRHAQVTFDGGDYFVTDLDSTNGTWVNDDRLAQHAPRRLRNRDLIKLAAGVVILRFEDLNATRMPEHQLLIHYDKRQVWVGDRQVEPPLSPQQFVILYFLYQNPHRVCSKDELANQGWPDVKGGVSDDMIYQKITSIRRRLRTLNKEHEYIRAVGQHGYQFEQPR